MFIVLKFNYVNEVNRMMVLVDYYINVVEIRFFLQILNRDFMFYFFGGGFLNYGFLSSFIDKVYSEIQDNIEVL